ncbi:MAG TPA: fasciclin domain-containing protein [Microbacterium sp.]|nr:fasciclin domain-containing protein [Microbacterium sp.]
MKKFLAVAATSAALVAACAVPASAADEPTMNIVEIALAASGGGAPDSNPNDYDLLVQAVLFTELQGVLGDPEADFTVFAPTDAAFLQLVTDLTGNAPANEADALATIASLGQEKVAKVLTYHVVGGSLGSDEIRRAKDLTTVNGGGITVTGKSLRDETSALRDPKLVKGATDIHATNGVIHTIDRVLVPGNF